MRRRPRSFVWSACERGRLALSGSASGRLSSGKREPAGARTSSGIGGALSPARRALAYGPFSGDFPFLGSGGQLLTLLASVCEVIATLCIFSIRPASRPVCALARSLVGCLRWCGASVNAIDLGGEEPWLVRASLIGRACLLCLSVSPPASGRLRWAMRGVAGRGASRTVAGAAGGGLFEFGSGRSPHLGAWLDECCWSSAPPAGAVRVRCFRPCAGTLAPGLREAPDYAPG